MYEEGLFKLENVLTVLIGIVIVAFVFLIIYRRRKAKRKILERRAEKLKRNEQIQYKEKK